MKTQCVMCGRDIAQGIVCEKCDRPKRSASKASSAVALDVHEELADAQRSAPAPTPSQPAADPFPKAPVVPFPRESTLALTSMYEVLAAAEVPSILLAADRVVKFVSPSAQTLLGLPPAGATLAQIESALGFSIPEAGQTFKLNVTLGSKKATVSVIPLSGGAGGHVVIMKIDETEPDSALMTFVREAVTTPLGALQAALAAAALRKKDPLLHDAINTIDQILSSLELAPRADVAMSATAQKKKAAPLPDILQNVLEQFAPLADMKGIKLQIDSPATSETFDDSEELEHALGLLLENSIHYVPDGGQIVLGLRFLEHKGRPLLLFFVMDNGPVVPEEMRETIFDPKFVWNPSAAERSGKDLAKCREFAVAHGGQIWVESKTGKACTFFMRVRPDSER